MAVSSIRNRSDLALVVVFLAVITLPAAGKLLDLAPNGIHDEKRALAEFPEPPRNATALRSWPVRFERYFDDHFGFRDRLIRWHNVAKVRLLNVSPSPRVLLGKRGWLFYAGDGLVDYYTGTAGLTWTHPSGWREVLEARRLWLAERGYPYVFLVAPNKHTIYPEHLPEPLSAEWATPLLDRWMFHLASRSQVEVIDPRQALLAAKSDREVYYRTDTHWTDVGAHVAYVATIERLRVHFPRLVPRPLEAFSLTTSPGEGGGLSRMLGLDDLLVETSTGLDKRSWSRARIKHAGERFVRVSAIDDPSLPRAVVFHDSFGTALIPLLAEHFSRAYFVRGGFNPAVVKRENPDVVIQIMCERFVMQPAPTSYPR